VGTRDVAARTIRRGFAPAPLDDLLGSFRVDWHPGDADTVMIRYAENEPTTPVRVPSTAPLDRRPTARRAVIAIISGWNLDPHSDANVPECLVGFFRTFRNRIDPVVASPQLTFPSLADGASFRVPQVRGKERFQLSDSATLVRGSHTIRAGGEWHRIGSRFDLDVFRQGRIELVEDFADFDHNGDGRIDDNDLLFAVTLRSGKPDQSLIIPDANNNYVGLFVQDDWRLRPDLTLNLVFATNSIRTSRTSAGWTRSTRWCSPS
jgi:hypothetical protein